MMSIIEITHMKSVSYIQIPKPMRCDCSCYSTLHYLMNGNVRTCLQFLLQKCTTMFLHDILKLHVSVTDPETNSADNMFIVFHNKGYDIYEPQHCLVRHEVGGDFTHMQYFPEMMDGVQSLCGDRECDWGTAINVANKFVYASQSAMNRVVIIDVTKQWNPVQVRVSGEMSHIYLHRTYWSLVNASVIVWRTKPG